MSTFLVSFAASALTSGVLVTLLVRYRWARHERIQAPVAKALWAEGEEQRRELRRRLNDEG